ncbi:hypothetical protein [Octadecabacter sp. R77987]|uniref:hypothetical protein n=1 Tax=Octadecabacter sp. R77987 TaxID=3093874 RepID=UPI00366E3C79
MSNNESFIDEVTEEVRRDQLFMYLRRYGWIAVACVLVLVGGAAFNEYRKASEAATAQALGDAVFAALENDDAADRATALAAIDVAGPAGAVAGLLEAAALQETGDVAGAAAQLDAIATDPEVAPIYRDLASLKSLMLQADTMDADTRRAALDALAVPGAPFRLLALEQIAFTHVAAGDNAAAIETLNAVLEDAEITRGLRDRAQSLIVALGGDLDGATDAGQ